MYKHLYISLYNIYNYDEKINNNYISTPNIDEIKNNSHVILIGDFLNNLADTKKVIKQLSDRGINGIIIHIVDPAEKSFPYRGRINFNGLEEEQNILIGKAESVRRHYKKAINLHFENLEKLAISYSWKYFLSTSDNEANISLFNICNTLANFNKIELES